jgi:hypothetical protein
VEFTGVELASGAELVALAEKAGRSCREGCAGSAHWRSTSRAGGVVEREEDRLPCSGAEEMPAGEVEVRWRGRRGGEGSAVESVVAEVARWRGSAVESAVVEVAQRSVVVESFHGTAVRSVFF